MIKPFHYFIFYEKHTQMFRHRVRSPHYKEIFLKRDTLSTFILCTAFLARGKTERSTLTHSFSLWQLNYIGKKIKFFLYLPENRKSSTSKMLADILLVWGRVARCKTLKNYSRSYLTVHNKTNKLSFLHTQDLSNSNQRMDKYINMEINFLPLHTKSYKFQRRNRWLNKRGKYFSCLFYIYAYTALVIRPAYYCLQPQPN
jgi:hypothetical protein